MTITIPVLSLWQPWASAMALQPPDKTIETRGWAAKHRGLFAIHAAKKWDADVRPLLDEPPFTGVREAWPDGLPLGGVVALSLLTDVQPAPVILQRPGFAGSLEHALGLYDEEPGKRRFGFLTAGTLPVQPMIPLRGQQQPFFDWQVDVETLLAATREATCLVHWSRGHCTMFVCLFCGGTEYGRLVVEGNWAVCPFCQQSHTVPPAAAA